MKASASVVSHHTANIVQQFNVAKNDDDEIKGMWIKTNVASIYLDVDTIKECYKRITN